MGEVYRARDTRLDRTVALNVFPQAWPTTVIGTTASIATRAISRLSHPHIGTLHATRHAHYVRHTANAFDVRVDANELLSYTVTPDGERFLVNTMVSDTSQPLVLVLSWRAGLKNKARGT